jgi:hypothetical protein
MGRGKLTAVNVLIHYGLLRALVHGGGALGLCAGAVDDTGRVENLLQRVALPAKDVVGVVAVARGVAKRPHERLAAVSGPVGLVVELARVPHGLEEHLRRAHGMAGRARAAALKRAVLRVRHVRHVVGRVEVHAVPARREARVDHDAGRARPRREPQHLGLARPRVVHARVRQLPEAEHLFLGARVDVADEHAEALSWFSKESVGLKPNDRARTHLLLPLALFGDSPVERP